MKDKLDRLDKAVEDLSRLRYSLQEEPRLVLYSFENHVGEPILHTLDSYLRGAADRFARVKLLNASPRTPYGDVSKDMLVCTDEEAATAYAKDRARTIMEHVFRLDASQQIKDFT